MKCIQNGCGVWCARRGGHIANCVPSAPPEDTTVLDFMRYLLGILVCECKGGMLLEEKYLSLEKSDKESGSCALFAVTSHGDGRGGRGSGNCRGRGIRSGQATENHNNGLSSTPVSTTVPTSRGTTTAVGTRDRRECYNCGEVGHTRTHCPEDECNK